MFDYLAFPLAITFNICFTENLFFIIIYECLTMSRRD